MHAEDESSKGQTQGSTLLHDKLKGMARTCKLYREKLKEMDDAQVAADCAFKSFARKAEVEKHELLTQVSKLLYCSGHLNEIC